MNNLKYFPFERNHYYYGKLLTEQDFNQEQRYMNDKRRLQNRFLNGVGVAAGMRTVLVDEKTISLEDGLALDFAGREILVDTPVVKRLSAIDGFDAIMEQKQGNVAYLCIAYQETESAWAHNAAGGDDQAEAFDKSKEGYHLYLTEREPDQMAVTADDLTRVQTVLYRDDRIVVTETSPISCRGGEDFETVVTVENLGNTVQLSLSLDLELEGGLVEDRSSIRMKWDKMTLKRSEKKSKSCRVHPMKLESGSVILEVPGEKLTVAYGGERRNGMEDKRTAIPVEEISAIESMTRRYFEESMEEVVKHNFPQGIYLARLTLVRRGDTYIIDRIEQVPFNQYVYSNLLLTGIARQLCKELSQVQQLLTQHQQPLQQAVPEISSAPDSRPQMAKGVAHISLGVGGKRGQRFFSSEIFHGLGLGQVKLQLAIQQDDYVYSGSAEIFEEASVSAEAAARQDVSRGAFVIGIRLTAPTSCQSVDVHWTAELLPGAEAQETQKKRLYIEPGLLELKVRQSHHLQAVCENLPDNTVLWSVITPEGGSISQDGTYTAPNVPGVYEVMAQYQDMPEISNSLLIIVRE